MGNEMAALEKRLDRFELNLDEIRGVLVQMARTEERVSVILDQNTALMRNQVSIENRLREIEKENATQGQSIGFFERAAWIVAGAAGSVATWFITR